MAPVAVRGDKLILQGFSERRGPSNCLISEVNRVGFVQLECDKETTKAHSCAMPVALSEWAIKSSTVLPLSRGSSEIAVFATKDNRALLTSHWDECIVGEQVQVEAVMSKYMINDSPLVRSFTADDMEVGVIRLKCGYALLGITKYMAIRKMVLEVLDAVLAHMKPCTSPYHAGDMFTPGALRSLRSTAELQALANRIRGDESTCEKCMSLVPEDEKFDPPWKGKS